MTILHGSEWQITSVFVVKG